MSWEGSTRGDGLPRWWPVTVRRIIARDPWCLCDGCPKCFTPEGKSKWTFLKVCHRPSQEVDHLGDRNDHRDESLAGKCKSCHGVKSSQQGNDAKAELKRPTNFFEEKHPGFLG